MDLTLSDEQQLLGQAARAFVDREFPRPRVREILADPDCFDRQRWDAMGALGWLGLPISERDGGSGGGLLDLALVCEALGRGPVPSPVVASTILAALPISWAGSEAQRQRWVPHLASGAAIGTLAIVEPGGRDEWAPPMVAGASRLDGTKILVPWAAVADVMLVATADGLRLVEPTTATVTTTRHDDLQADPWYAVELAAADAEPLGTGDRAEGRATVRQVLDHAAVLQLAYALGAAEAALGLSLDHARTRHQFGRPIGSFQAVAHRCVDMRTDLDATRFLTYRAAWALDHDGPVDLAVGAAKAYGNDALRRIFGHAHQVHGAMGFSTEVDLHLFTRVAKTAELAYGTTTRHLDRVATAMGLG